MSVAGFRIGGRDRQLLELAANREDLSFSEFIRRAALDRAKRMLAGIDTQMKQRRFWFDK